MTNDLAKAHTIVWRLWVPALVWKAGFARFINKMRKPLKSNAVLKLVPSYPAEYVHPYFELEAFVFLPVDIMGWQISRTCYF